MLNTGKFAGKTVLITGGSRGIGKAIALKLAKDGANIIVAAKTATPHAKLPGTIYTACEEIEAIGGKCLPCTVDVREEAQVQEAVENAVKQFGGIDILVNNASAISLTGTLATPMKKFDLMHSINLRGTYLMSQKCIPYLKQGKNPHILNISPPLNMAPKWFGPHVAYTMAKYGMSMCVLGMAKEFKKNNIAVNALWPRTAIWTSAMEMLAGKEVAEQCRKDSIMADAAYCILSRDSKSFTGNFCIDDEVLKQEGVTNFDDYAFAPGKPLLPDFFLEEAESPDAVSRRIAEQGAAPRFRDGKEQPTAPLGRTEEHVKQMQQESGGGGGGGISDVVNSLKGLVTQELVGEIKACYKFNLTGDGATTVVIDLKTTGDVKEGDTDNADATMTLSASDFVSMFQGKLNPTTAFMGGKLKIQGDMGKALKLEKLLKKMQKSKL